MKDRRVDRMLLKEGVEGATIYYSPIANWVGLLFMFLGLGSFVLTWLWHLGYIPVLGVYLIVACLAAAKFNFSVATTQKEIIFINPNPPFKSFQRFSLKDILSTKIGTSSKPYFFYLFCLFYPHYVEISLHASTHRFYCVGIDYDDPFEGMTDLFLDDMYGELKEKGVMTSCEGCSG